MAQVTADPLIGRLVDGRYEIVARVARGGMATVYRAHDRRLNREIALKVMHPHLADGEQAASFRQRFEREARSAAGLQHHGVVAVYDQGTDADMRYLTMEYVPGTNLRQLIRDGDLTLRRSFAILDVVLSALAAAHVKGIVHRDIKPENVLLEEATGRPKVADFGLARAISEVSNTTTGTVLGTVAYLAPETISTGHVDARADVYAVGILAFEMFTGRLPHEGEGPIQVAFAHVNTDVPPVSAFAGHLGRPLDLLVRALTARDPDRRPRDAAVALDVLRSTFRQIPNEVLDIPAKAAPPPSSAAVKAARTAVVERPPAGVWVAQQPPQPPPPPARRPRRGGKLLLAVAVVAVLFSAWWYTEHGPGAYAVVPDGVVGVSAEQANEALIQAGLTPSSAKQYDSDVPEGDVVSADPGEGQRWKRDEPVRLVISLGPELAEVPADLDSMRERAARAALRGVGLTDIKVSREYSSDVVRGEVIWASVRGGDMVPTDETVRLTVSSGPPPLTVPDVTGLGPADAADTLVGMGFEVERKDKFDDLAPVGTVIKTEPGTGKGVKDGGTVTIVVSMGPKGTVPDVVGISVEDAKKVLKEAGYKVEVRGFGELFGEGVQETEPAAGELLKQGESVTIWTW
ncbi:Stk1 family PASTA domain-containing Ser/Thr kinase [Promicromonospora soli]|uniref:Stk1 family PASTA domain-containing Ser/Thr kinase n=1 Tax=Promicromonospora soli TaxID=2035533 RepID=UPI001679C4EE|nr:Stk1 family PASTA domain-containing Ser/Thr kinase [Promicromonospora soli]